MPCHALIKDTDIANIYNIKQVKKCSINSNCITPHEKITYITPLDKNGSSIVYYPITRKYLKKAPLYSFNAEGKVAKHEVFHMREQYRDQKIASDLMSNELKLYQQESFNEIQLEAASDGVVVWTRLGYKYVNRLDETLLLMQWKDYFINHYVQGSMTLDKKAVIISKVNEVKDIPKQYLKQIDGASFADMLLQNKTLQMLKMYYRVDV